MKSRFASSTGSIRISFQFQEREEARDIVPYVSRDSPRLEEEQVIRGI